MASVYEAAVLAEAVYDDTLIDRGRQSDLALSLGWVKVATFPDAYRSLPLVGTQYHPDGFFACLFRHDRTTEFVYAIRGTDFAPSSLWLFDAWNDLFIAYGAFTRLGGYDDAGALVSIPTQFWHALDSLPEVLRHTQGRSFYVTGHSLGGALAALVGAFAHVPTVTFNSAGVSFLTSSLGRQLYWTRRDDLRAIHARSRCDPVSTLTGRNPGTEIRLPVRESCWNPLGQHSMANLREAIANEPVLRIDLGWLDPAEHLSIPVSK